MLWKSEYALGVEPIDSQHKELFRRLERLSGAVRQGEAQGRLRETMNFLSAYVDWHFDDEQKLMDRSDYPDREAHREFHQGFQQELASFRRGLLDEGFTEGQAGELLERLSGWLVEHILGEDQKVKVFLARKEAAGS